MVRSMCAVLLALTLTGCGGGGGGGAGYTKLKLAPVSGVVLVNGTAVEKPVVTFFPEKGASGTGVGDEKGNFSIRTNGSRGAPVGKCKVTVTSTAGYEIPPSDGNEIKIKIKPKVPAKYSSVDTTDLIIDVPEAGNQDLKLELD